MATGSACSSVWLMRPPSELSLALKGRPACHWLVLGLPSTGKSTRPRSVPVLGPRGEPAWPRLLPGLLPTEAACAVPV